MTIQCEGITIWLSQADIHDTMHAVSQLRQIAFNQGERDLWDRLTKLLRNFEAREKDMMRESAGNQ